MDGLAPVNDINDLIVFEFSRLVGIETPQILTAFASTKESIKGSILTLKNSEKTFDNDDKLLESKVANYSQEISTNPDFSNIAMKMSLHTVPMIMKGLAERYDTNIQLASVIRIVADLAGVNILPPVASLAAFGATGLIPGPFGIAYLASGYLEPKERKRIKEMINGRNTNSDSAIQPDEDILDTLETLSEIAREEAIRQFNDHVMSIISSIIPTIISDSDILLGYTSSLRYITGGWRGIPREGGFYLYVPVARTLGTNTIINVTDFRNDLRTFRRELEDSNSLIDILKVFRDELDYTLFEYSYVAHSFIQGKDPESPYTNSDIEELLEQDDEVQTDTNEDTVSGFKDTRVFLEKADIFMDKMYQYTNFLTTCISLLAGIDINYYVGDEFAENPPKLSDDVATLKQKLNATLDLYAETSITTNATNYKNTLKRWSYDGTRYLNFKKMIDSIFK